MEAAHACEPRINNLYPFKADGMPKSRWATIQT